MKPGEIALARMPSRPNSPAKQIVILDKALATEAASRGMSVRIADVNAEGLEATAAMLRELSQLQ